MPIKLGPFELMIILTLVVIIFGIGKVPDVARSMGQAIREFRAAQGEKETPAGAPSLPQQRAGTGAQKGT
jgi:sec-independent protein translocase protein TatA